jgi:hypothetical protein
MHKNINIKPLSLKFVMTVSFVILQIGKEYLLPYRQIWYFSTSSDLLVIQNITSIVPHAKKQIATEISVSAVVRILIWHKINGSLLCYTITNLYYSDIASIL